MGKLESVKRELLKQIEEYEDLRNTQLKYREYEDAEMTDISITAFERAVEIVDKYL